MLLYLLMKFIQFEFLTSRKLYLIFEYYVIFFKSIFYNFKMCEKLRQKLFNVLFFSKTEKDLCVAIFQQFFFEDALLIETYILCYFSF